MSSPTLRRSQSSPTSAASRRSSSWSTLRQEGGRLQRRARGRRDRRVRKGRVEESGRRARRAGPPRCKSERASARAAAGVRREHAFSMPAERLSRHRAALVSRLRPSSPPSAPAPAARAYDLPLFTTRGARTFSRTRTRARRTRSCIRSSGAPRSTAGPRSSSSASRVRPRRPRGSARPRPSCA